MKLYFEFPYLNTINVTVKKRKTLKNKLHLTTNETIFSPQSPGGIPSDIGTFDDIPVSEVYVEDGEIYHVLEEKSRKSNFVQSVDLSHRIDIMQQYGAAVLYTLAFRRLLSIDTQSITIDKNQMRISVDLIDSSVDIKKMLTSVMKVVNSIIDNSLDIKISEAKENYSATIDSLGTIELLSPVPTNTSEMKSTVITSYKLNEGLLDIYILAGNRAMNHLFDRMNYIRQIRSMLNVDDSSVVATVKQMVDESEALQSELSELRNFVYMSYIKELEIPSYNIEDYSVINHYVQDLDIVDLTDFIDLLPTSISIVAKNEGEFSGFCSTNKIDSFDIMKVFNAVKEIYPFEINLLDGYYNGRILTQYLERFLDAFDKYLKEMLTDFIENPPTDEQLEIEDTDNEIEISNEDVDEKSTDNVDSSEEDEEEIDE